MEKRFFDSEPNNWQQLEILVQQAFEEMGYDSIRGYNLRTARGSANIDVFARKVTTPIPTVVLCECKYWNKSVSQSVIHSFRSVCQDAGAHFGVIISKKGFQSGALEACENTNIHLMDFYEFQETFFSEWQSGAFMILARMRDQLLPILRAHSNTENYGLDIFGPELLQNLDPWEKYWMYFGTTSSEFFIGDSNFPFRIHDPRENPLTVNEIVVNSHRELIDIARTGMVDAMAHFKLPEIWFDAKGKFLKQPRNIELLKLAQNGWFR